MVHVKRSTGGTVLLRLSLLPATFCCCCAAAIYSLRARLRSPAITQHTGLHAVADQTSAVKAPFSANTGQTAGGGSDALPIGLYIAAECLLEFSLGHTAMTCDKPYDRRGVETSNWSGSCSLSCAHVTVQTSKLSKRRQKCSVIL
jgi:hypothetical protein